jgi:hypothetical protein
VLFRYPLFCCNCVEQLSLRAPGMNGVSGDNLEVMQRKEGSHESCRGSPQDPSWPHSSFRPPHSLHISPTLPTHIESNTYQYLSLHPHVCFAHCKPRASCNLLYSYHLSNVGQIVSSPTPSVFLRLETLLPLYLDCHHVAESRCSRFRRLCQRFSYPYGFPSMFPPPWVSPTHTASFTSSCYRCHTNQPMLDQLTMPSAPPRNDSKRPASN